MNALPASVDETLSRLGEGDYVAERSLATAVFLTLRMGRPLFLEGEAGVGKTEVARVLARVLGRRLVRLQCYEGLDVASAVYEWNYPRQMIRIRLAELGGGGPSSIESVEEDIYSRPVSHRAPSSRRPESRPRRRPGAAHRRARPGGRAVRGIPSRAARRLPDHDPRARHDRGERTAGGGHHLESNARDPRRRQAPLLLPLGRLPGGPRASSRSCGCGRREPRRR